MVIDGDAHGRSILPFVIELFDTDEQFQRFAALLSTGVDVETGVGETWGGGRVATNV
jgi:hypothetical protein